VLEYPRDVVGEDTLGDDKLCSRARGRWVI
jgi:hypothetical protein